MVREGRGAAVVGGLSEPLSCLSLCGVKMFASIII